MCDICCVRISDETCGTSTVDKATVYNPQSSACIHSLLRMSLSTGSPQLGSSSPRSNISLPSGCHRLRDAHHMSEHLQDE